MITPQLKDQILNDLVNSAGDSMEADIDIDNYKLSFSAIHALFKQFNQMNLIGNFGRNGDGSMGVFLTVNAHDFVQRGGFTGQEMLLKANIEKLGFEIDVLAKELSPKGLEAASKIASIGSAILSALSLMR